MYLCDTLASTGPTCLALAIYEDWQFINTIEVSMSRACNTRLASSGAQQSFLE